MVEGCGGVAWVGMGIAAAAFHFPIIERYGIHVPRYSLNHTLLGVFSVPSILFSVLFLLQVRSLAFHSWFGNEDYTM